MNKLNYSQIYTKLTKNVSEKVKNIFDRRFGVVKATKNTKNSEGGSETLESIGKSLGITRERVRQIEEAGFTSIRKNHKDLLEAIFADLDQYFADQGSFKLEEALINNFGGEKNKPYVLFLLTIRKKFFKETDKKDYYSFWASDKSTVQKVKESLNSLVSDFKVIGHLMSEQELFDNFTLKYNLTNKSLSSYIEVSKRIQKNQEGMFGLSDWPEIKPRGVKDKAFLVLKKMQKPLHFREIAALIDKLGYGTSRKAHPQTVHNELIKDTKFVLVGRGTYGLKDWGYIKGTIRDVIFNTLKTKPHLASQEEIVKEVLSQRMVARNTVLINLGNKKYFNKDQDGKYYIRETA